jgi:hypothetical protein
MYRAVILSVHIADVGSRALPALLRARPASPGLRWAVTTLTAPLAARAPIPRPGRVGLIAAWEDDEAFDRFLDSDPLARRLAGGWHVRLEPLRTYGRWSALPDLPSVERPVDDGERVAVLTLGRLKLTRVLPFLRTSTPAERRAVRDPELLASTGLARPPRLVSTFSVWRTAAAMREYAVGNDGAEHLHAIRAHQARPFHHESVFVRFRPYAMQGRWGALAG